MNMMRDASGRVDYGAVVKPVHHVRDLPHQDPGKPVETGADHQAVPSGQPQDTEKAPVSKPSQ